MRISTKVTPPIFGTSNTANRSACASAYLPPEYPGCGGVTEDFAQAVSGQHGQPKYYSGRAADDALEVIRRPS